MALAGLGLIAFIVVHLLGNLTLYRSDGQAFNQYAHVLQSVGRLVLLAEGGLALLFLIHSFIGVWVKIVAWRARGSVGYDITQSKGGPSYSNWASRTMIYTGPVILFFVILHVWQFRFGPGVEEGYVTIINGVAVRDLYRLVVEAFMSPLIAGLYIAAMVVVGFHLRHAFWSGWQSLGLMSPRCSKMIYGIGLVFAILVAAGFLFIPVWIFLMSYGAFK